MSETAPPSRMISPAPTVPAHALDVFVELLGEADAGADAFYGRLCEAICRAGAMQRAVLFRYDEEERRVRAAGAHGLALDVFADADVTVESAPIAAQALMRDEVVETAVEHAEVPPAFRALLDHGRLFCVPIAAGGRWIGVVLCDRSEDRALTADERDLLWTLGKAAALAASARIATYQSERARSLRQRLDLARELHDEVVQRLFGTALVLRGEGPLPAGDRRRAADEVERALSDLRDAIRRPLARDPRPATTSFAGELARQRAAHPQLPIVAGRTDVPPALEALAQSVLREALRNAAKHAAPSEVRVDASAEGDAFVLEIVNDGVAGVAGTPGTGLRLATYEALEHGGFVEYGERGGHWRVRLAVPLDDHG